MPTKKVTTKQPAAKRGAGKRVSAPGVVKKARRHTPVFRFAQPFFTPKSPAQRTSIPGIPGHSASQWGPHQVGPIPKPKGNSVMTLADLIGTADSDAIAKFGTLTFHSTGDTGRPGGGGAEEEVAIAMALDYDAAHPEKCPVFLFHLGDVIYGQDKTNHYRDEFYRPYMKYPGKIIAIPGNHDGEIFAGTDPKPVGAFLDNFCGPLQVLASDPSSVGVMRQMPSQPGVYWRVDAPLVDVIGLYSNILEGPGDLRGAGNDMQQINWLGATLKTIADTRKAQPKKALIVATHHPPFSNSGHSGSTAMLAQLDQACQQTGVWPDAVLSGHAHNYQRHTRKLPNGATIPYFVSGWGGHADAAVAAATGQKGPNGETFDKSMKGFGYLRVDVTKSLLTITAWQVNGAIRTKVEAVPVKL